MQNKTETIKCTCRSYWNPPVPKLKTTWLPTQTVPDDTMSLREIISKYVNGIPISNARTPIYDEENESMGINPKTLDLVDIQHLKEENHKRIFELQMELQKETDSKEKERIKNERDALEKEIREAVKNENADKEADKKH